MKKNIFTLLITQSVIKMMKGSFVATLVFFLATTGSSRADVLVTNNFDTGTSQDWTLSGNASLYSGTNYSYSTPYAVDLLSGSGGAYATLTTPLALVSAEYTNVTWKFYINGDIASGYNKAYTQYSKDGGATWIELDNWTVQYTPTGFLTYSISAADLSDNFLFRFYLTANTASKHVYLDNMVITAKPDVPPAGTVLTIQ